MVDDINAISSAGDGASTARTMTVTNAQEAFSLTLTAASHADVEHNISFVDSSGTSDSMSLTLSATINSAMGDVNANAVETISINSDDTNLLTLSTHSVTLTANALKTLTITGDAALTLTNVSTTLTSLDATGNGKGVSWAAIPTLAAAATITGGAGADNLGGATNTAAKALTMDGGSGQDTLQGGLGADTITDTSVETNLDGNDFDGAGGNDTISGGTGEDTIAT